MSFVEHIMQLVEASRGPLGLAILAACALIEYVFPPFPGDAVAVFGAFLVVSRGWSAVGVWGAVLVGSAGGSMISYGAGRLLGKSEAHWQGRWAGVRPQVDWLVERFRRHGALYIAINRFLPSLRALFFVAAGMARLSPWRVLGFGLVSAAAWNALLFGLGAEVGLNWPRLQRIFAAYGIVAWSFVAAIGVGLGIRWWWRRRAKTHV